MSLSSEPIQIDAPTAQGQGGTAEERYVAATPGSRALWDRARKVFPGGVVSGVGGALHPVYATRGQGCFLYDVDGREIVDFMNSAHSLPFGHNFAPTMEAIRRQTENGLHFMLPSEPPIRFAELLCERIPSFERIRPCSSGTEATMYAMRLARAFTGRERILRMVGSYHGTHDGVLVGEAGEHRPLSQPGTSGDTALGWGIPRNVVDTAATAHFNDLDSARRAFEEHPGEMAGIIVEPIPGAGGHIAPEPGYLQGLRDLCDEHGALLIFDEMITISTGRGGAQGVYGVTPDLTTAGKGIAGGMPLGIVGGRAEVMALCEVRGDRPPVFHTSTFAGHPLVMVAGVSTLEHLTPDVYEKMASLGEYARQGLRDVVARTGAPMDITGAKHLIGFHVSDGPVTTFAQAQRDPRAKQRMSLSLLAQGFFLPIGRASVTAAHDEQVIDRLLVAFEVALSDAGLTAA